MLTGKNIWEAYAELDAPQRAWESLSERVQAVYNAVADKLNAQLSKAEEEASAVEYSADMVKVLLEQMIRFLGEVRAWNRAGNDLIPFRATTMLMLPVAFDLVANILPDDIRPLVRQILALYEQATKEE